MERISGVVMERTGNQVILLTPRGEFKSVRITGTMPDIGAEIHVPVIHGRFLNIPRARWLAVAASIILLLAAGPLLTFINLAPEVAVASVWLDEPGIELTVSNRNNILDAAAYSPEGKKLLAALHLKGTNYDQAFVQIAREVSKNGFSGRNSGDKILISVSMMPDAQFDRAKIEKTILASADDVIDSGNIKGIQTIHVPAEVSENARKKGLSPGKYAVFIEAVTEGLPLTEEDLKDNNIKDIITRAGGQPDQIIDRVGKEGQLEQKEKKYLAIAALKENTSPGVLTTIGTEAEQGIPDKSAGIQAEPGKIKYIDPIRRTGGPEERPDETRTGPETKPPVSTKPAVTTTPAVDSEIPDNSKQADEGSNANDSSPGGKSEDESARDNYMGPEKPDGAGTNEDMYILRPNF